jgi:hypothetical protein
VSLPPPISFDGPCPFLTCTETEAHEHPCCPACGAVRYGNITCKTCRDHHGLVVPALDALPTQAPLGAGPVRAFMNRLRGQ